MLIGFLLISQIVSGLSNSDVITLHNAGIGADTIVLAINNAEEKRFDTSAAALVELKEAGVDESVIQAILLSAGVPLKQAEMEEAPDPAPKTIVEREDPPPPPPEPEKPVVRRPPQPVYRPAPVYPPTLREKGITGSVKLQFTVDVDGDVRDITILESDNELFSAAASEALTTWKFNPGTEDGKPVDSDVKMEMPFNIREAASSINRAPKALYNPKPTYPKALRQEGITGDVKVQFIVNTAGEVQDIKVISSDNELFTKEAIKVLQQWKFAPALKNGQAIDSRVQFSVPFKITD